MLYIVCIWHLDDYTPALQFDNTVTQLLTTCALGLFVFLSGFLLSNRYRVATLSDVRRFYVRRLLRILPMYLVTLAGFYLGGLTTLSVAAKGIVCLNVVSGSPPPTLWFVEVICWLYLITPFLLYRYSSSTALCIGGTLTLALLLGNQLTRGASTCASRSTCHSSS